jgi:hypothetical protein
VSVSVLQLSFDIVRALAWLRLRPVETDADKLRAALDRLGLSQRELARQLEVPERDLRHLFAGQGKAPAWLWLAIEALERRQSGLGGTA